MATRGNATVYSHLVRIAYELIGEFRKALGMEHGEQRGDGAASMAEGELGFEVEFGHGAVEGGEIEKGVVAEATGASGGFKDEAFDGALGGVERVAVAGGYQDAAVTGGAFGGIDAGQAL